MKRALALASSFVVLSTAACKQSAGGDDAVLKFDENVANIVNFNDLSKDEQVEICKRSVLVMFVGNAEDVAKGSLAGSRPPKPEENAVKLEDVMKDAGNRLQAALDVNDCGPWAAKQPKDKRPTVLLAVVLDGSGHNDSSVTSFEYKWSDDGKTFKRGAGQKWKADKDGKLSKGEGSFELHLPTMTSSIAKQFFDSKDGGFDQTMYFFKTHGGRLLTEKENGEPVAPSLAHLLKPAAELKKWEASSKHLFLFDPHGPDKDQSFVTTPGVFTAYWDADDACKLLAESGDRAKLVAAEACLACQLEAHKDKKPLGAFAECRVLGESGSGASTLGSNGSASNTLGESGSGASTLGSNGSASNTLGANGSASSTLGANGSASSTLGANGSASSTLGANGSGASTLGASGSGSSTLDVTGSGTSTLSAVGVGTGTLGGGKGFLHLARPTIGEKATLTQPDGAKQVASAVSYDLEPRYEGVSTLSLPAGKDAKAATFIILDSCYGDSGVGKLVDGRGGKVVVVTNPSPMLANVFNYGALSLTKYVAFTSINTLYDTYKEEKVLDQHPKIKAMKEKLDDYLAQQGLVDMPALRAALEKAKREGRELTDAERQAIQRPRQYRSLKVETYGTGGR